MWDSPIFIPTRRTSGTEVKGYGTEFGQTRGNLPGPGTPYLSKTHVMKTHLVKILDSIHLMDFR